VDVGVDLWVLVFAVAMTLLSTVLSGLSPALAGARTQVADALQSGRTMTRRLSLHKLTVVAQVATCTLLLIGAGLLVETLGRMQSMDAGFDRDHIVSFTLDPRMKGYGAEQALFLTQQMVEKTRALPSVAAVSVANRPLMRGTGMKASFAPAGAPIHKEDFLNCSTNAVAPGYFETMGMQLIAGRDFGPFDRNDQKPSPVIVNQAFVRRFFPNQDPIGRRVGMGRMDSVAAPDMEIVGVVSNAKYRSLREEIHPTVYNLLGGGLRYGFTLHVRTEPPSGAVIGSVRDILRSLDPELPFVEVHTLRQEVEASLWQERLLAGLSSIFGAIAVLLVCIGLYATLDYAVKARTREIGVRCALGAAPARIVRLLGGETLVLVIVGITLGFAAQAVLGGWIREVLYSVEPWNLVALCSAMVLIGLAAVLASLPPILRAVRIDPASALRQE
jgi:predicted permease